MFRETLWGYLMVNTVTGSPPIYNVNIKENRRRLLLDHESEGINIFERWIVSRPRRNKQVTTVSNKHNLSMLPCYPPTVITFSLFFWVQISSNLLNGTCQGFMWINKE